MDGIYIGYSSLYANLMTKLIIVYLPVFASKNVYFEVGMCAGLTESGEVAMHCRGSSAAGGRNGLQDVDGS